MKHRGLETGAWVVCLLVAAGCERITIAPSCPESMSVGQSAELRANEQDPGAIPVYFWEVSPSGGGKFSDPFAPNTQFQALMEGQLTLQLTASDGLFQMINTCSILVEGVLDLAVSLSASPATALPMQTVMLSCISVGESSVTSFSVVRVSGPEVTLSEVDPGQYIFNAPPIAQGTIGFRCIGMDDVGNTSEASFVTVTLPGPPIGNGNANSSANDNANRNDNGS